MTATLTALPGMLDLVLYAGDATKIQFDLTSGGNPWVAPGTLKAQMRPEYGSTTVYEFTVVADELVDGRYWVTVPPTAALVVDAPLCSKYVNDDLVTAPMWQGVWDWQWTEIDASVHTITAGKVTVIGEVTK